MTRRFSLLIVSAILTSCATVQREMPYEPPAIGAPAEAVFRDRWATYLANFDGVELQPDCRPRLVEPAANSDYRGTVVLLHGFTACPQQWAELAGLLSLRGYRTVLPLLPGHGRQFDDPGSEEIDDLPDGRDWKTEYDYFAEQVNGLMRYARGERVIGGLSAGGAASLYINARAREIYDRNIIFAPFFDAGTNPAAGSAVSVAAATPGVRQASVKPFGIRKPCLERRAQGRAGFCNYQARHLKALTAMGHELREMLGAEPLAVRLQFVGVENDKVASNAASREFLDSQKNSPARVSACFYPDGVPHAMISGYDNPDIDMYWLDSLLAGSIGFITEGRAFATLGQASTAEAPYDLCAIRTERSD